jgi:hypothetical protein
MTQPWARLPPRGLAGLARHSRPKACAGSILRCCQTRIPDSSAPRSEFEDRLYAGTTSKSVITRFPSANTRVFSFFAVSPRRCERYLLF